MISQKYTAIYLDGIAATIRSKADLAYRVLENVEDYEKFLDNNEHSIIGM